MNDHYPDDRITHWFAANLGIHTSREVSWHFIENAWDARNGMKFDMPMCSYHLENWLDFSHGVLIFPFLAPVRLSETGQNWGFQDFLGNAWEEWPTILHANVSWLLSALTRFCWRSIDSPSSNATIIWWNRYIWGFGLFPWKCLEHEIWRADLYLLIGGSTGKCITLYLCYSDVSCMDDWKMDSTRLANLNA